MLDDESNHNDAEQELLSEQETIKQMGITFALEINGGCIPSLACLSLSNRNCVMLAKITLVGKKHKLYFSFL